MKQKIQTGTLAAALVLAGAMVSAQAANGPRYTYVEGGYLYTELDDPTDLGVDVDGNGYFLVGSWAANDVVHLFGSYSDSDLKADFGVGSEELDYTTLNLGVGLSWPLNDRIDLVGRAAWVDLEADYEGESADESGFGLSVGVRSMLTDRFELNAAVNYVNLGSDFDETSFALGLVYGVSEMLALTLGGEIGDEATAFTAGVRLYFGDR